MNIMSIDDSKAMRLIIKNAVDVLGYGFVEANDGKEALEYLESSSSSTEENPELVVSAFEGDPGIEGGFPLGAGESEEDSEQLPIDPLADVKAYLQEIGRLKAV